VSRSPLGRRGTLGGHSQSGTRMRWGLCRLENEKSSARGCRSVARSLTIG
jgi:hypothetical protein